MKQRILFICVHNSARSQMAEAFTRMYAGDRFEVHSAGLETGTLNPLVVKAMEEIDISMDGHFAKKASEYAERGERFDYIVTVCDEASAERCPVFSGRAVRLHWSFPDPSSFNGTQEEKLANIRIVRDAIKEKVESWLSGLATT